MRRQHWKTGKQDPTFAQNLHAKTLPLDVKTIIKCIYFFVNINVFFQKE